MSNLLQPSLRNSSDTISVSRAPLSAVPVRSPSSNTMHFEDSSPFSLPSSPSNLPFETRTRLDCGPSDPVSINHYCTASMPTVDNHTELLCEDMYDQIFGIIDPGGRSYTSIFMGAVALVVFVCYICPKWVFNRGENALSQPVRPKNSMKETAESNSPPMTRLEREQAGERAILKRNYEKKMVFRMNKHEEEKRAQLVTHTNEALKDDKEMKDKYEALDKKYEEDKQKVDEEKAKKKQERVQRQTAEAEDLAGDHRVELQGPTEEYEAAQLEMMQKHAKQTGSLKKMKTKMTSTRAELQRRRAFMRSEKELRQQVNAAEAQWAANAPTASEHEDEADDDDTDEGDNDAQSLHGEWTVGSRPA